MRELIFYSEKARTSGNIQNMMEAGRIDIACHSIIASFFLSHKIRKDVKLHLIFNGPPDPPKHIEITSSEEMKEFVSKKDILGLLKIMLYKYRKGKKIEVFKGCFIDKKTLSTLVEEFAQNKYIFLLDKNGTDISKIGKEQLNEAVFIVGDDDGIPKKELKLINKFITNKISLGNEDYFSSQAIVILHNWLDRL